VPGSISVACSPGLASGSTACAPESHEAAQRAKLALDQADAALLARNDDEQCDDGDKAIRFSNMAVPPNQASLLTFKCGGQTAGKLSVPPLAPGMIEHVSKRRPAAAANIPHRRVRNGQGWADDEVACRQPPSTRGILYDGSRRKCDGIIDAETKCGTADLQEKRRHS